MTQQNIRIVGFGAGGLCNRIQCIDACHVLARRLGARLTILWPGDGDSLKAAFSDLFAPPEPAIEVCHIRWRDVNEYLRAFSPTREFFNESLRDLKICPTTWIPEGLVPTDRLLFKTHLRFVHDQPGETLFVPRQDVQAVIDQHACLAQGAVGVHVRRADKAISIQHSTNEAFFRLLDAIPDSDSILVSSDDPTAEAAFRDRYGARIHTYAKRSWKRDSAVGMQDAVVELHLLARTTRIIGSYGSSFSKTAAFLGDIPLEFACLPANQEN